MEDHFDIEKVLFSFMSYIVVFNQYIRTKYQLTDIPYNVKGIEFPKNGIEKINEIDVWYQFHGRGCTIKWGETEINFDIDATSIHGIIISGYSIGKFVQTASQFKYWSNVTNFYTYMEHLLKLLERKGVLMTRKSSDMGSFHINEVWYESYKSGSIFTGANKDEIDWL